MKCFEKLLKLKDITEILEKLPKHTKLYSPAYGECRLGDIMDNGEVQLHCIDSDVIFTVDRKGRYVTDTRPKSEDGYDMVKYLGERILFPSKNNHNWESLTLEKGDLLENGNEIAIFDKMFNDFDGAEVYNVYNETTDEYWWSKVIDNPNDWVKIGKSEEANRDINRVQPFDTVLVRNSKDGKWVGSVLNSIDNDSEFPYVTGFGSFKYCIHYRSNENLKGTTLSLEEK